MALVGQPWFEPPIEPLAAVMRRQLDSYPFRQLPRYVEEGDVDLVQSMVGLTCTWAGCGGGVGLCRFRALTGPGQMLLAPTCSSSFTPLPVCCYGSLPVLQQAILRHLGRKHSECAALLCCQQQPDVPRLCMVPFGSSL